MKPSFRHRVIGFLSCLAIALGTIAYGQDPEEEGPDLSEGPDIEEVIPSPRPAKPPRPADQPAPATAQPAPAQPKPNPRPTPGEKPAPPATPTPMPPTPATQPPGSVDPWLFVFDINGDGKLSINEVNFVVTSMRELDLDRNGLLDHGELARRVKPGASHESPTDTAEDADTPPRHSAYDKDGDGSIAYKDVPKRAQETFKKFDRNRDAILDPEEIKGVEPRYRGRLGFGDRRRATSGSTARKNR